MEKDKVKGGADMETQITQREKNLQSCPFCQERPAGFGIEALKFNFRTHLEKHLRRNEITNEELEIAMKRLFQSINENDKK
jgi:hypothetical protein